MNDYEVTSLRKHIDLLRHAVATTTCKHTRGVLREMLEEANDSLAQQDEPDRASGYGRRYAGFG